MRTIFFIIFSIIVIQNVQSQSREFLQGNWQTVLAVAQKENKDILLLYYSPHSKNGSALENKVFTNKNLMNQLTAKFILYSIEQQPINGIKKFENCELLTEPSFIFFDKGGNPLHQRSVIITADELLRVSNDIRNPDSAYYSLKSRFESDTTNMETLYNYLISKSKIGVFDSSTSDFDPMADKYFKTLTENEMYSEKNWNAIRKLVYTINDSTFDYLLQNKEKYVGLFGNEVNDVIQYIIYNSLMVSPIRFQQNGDKALYEKSKKLVLAGNYSDSKEVIEFVDGLMNGQVFEEKE